MLTTSRYGRRFARGVKSKLRSRTALRAAFLGIDVREFRAEVEKLGGVISPRQDNHYGASRSVRGHRHAFSNVKADEEFTGGEQQGSEHSTDPYIAPRNFNIGEQLENQSHEHSDKEK